ncbi:MAG TPA: hypothetical protein VNQ77_07285 [Frankiaceae bacterium]|nr:hypothetical protein [Frankiaceae bacterium]
MRASVAAVVAAVVLAGCGGSSPEPVASETPTPSATTKKPRPKPKPTKTATPSPTPTATTPPPVTGDPVTTAESLVALVDPGVPRQGSECRALVPDMATPACLAVKTDAGQLVSATGRIDGRKAIRLLVQTPNGYVARYEGRDDGRSWAQLKVYATPLTGQGLDGVVFSVRLTDGALTYDVLTWARGGPLVLRAHRGPVADGRLVPRAEGLDEYAQAVDGSYVLRRLAWDGRRFLISKGVRATTVPGR